jgi:pSer/pThr/pTyr-binding forkhead associated (FHA) protein
MTSETLTPPAAVDGITERFDPISCLDERIRHQAIEGAPEQPGRYILIEGLERSLVIELEDEPLHIGRGLGSDLHLDESTVSRKHAIIQTRPEGLRILDDRSANGTYVNGARVQQADLTSGDAILIGRVAMRYLEVS